MSRFTAVHAVPTCAVLTALSGVPSHRCLPVTGVALEQMTNGMSSPPPASVMASGARGRPHNPGRGCGAPCRPLRYLDRILQAIDVGERHGELIVTAAGWVSPGRRQARRLGRYWCWPWSSALRPPATTRATLTRPRRWQPTSGTPSQRPAPSRYLRPHVRRAAAAPRCARASMTTPSGRSLTPKRSPATRTDLPPGVRRHHRPSHDHLEAADAHADLDAARFEVASVGLFVDPGPAHRIPDPSHRPRPAAAYRPAEPDQASARHERGPSRRSAHGAAAARPGLPQGRPCGSVEEVGTSRNRQRIDRPLLLEWIVGRPDLTRPGRGGRIERSCARRCLPRGARRNGVPRCGYRGDGRPRRSRRATWGSWSEAWSANSALTCTGS
jgi:hypothetical protein